MWVAGTANDRFPFYLRQIAVSLGKVIERRQPEALQKLVTRGRLRVLNKPASLIDQAAFLAQQYARGGVSRHYEPQLANLYSATWRAISERQAAEPQWLSQANASMPLLARRHGELAAVTPGAEGAPPVYVRDNDDELAPSLVASLGGMLFDVKNADRRKIGVAVEAIYGKKVIRLSRVQYDVRVDGTPLEELQPALSVIDACPWVCPMLAVAMEGLKSTDALRLPSDRAPMLGRLLNVRLSFASEVMFEIEGQPVTGPGARLAYVFRRADGALVVLLHQAPMTWTALDRCLPSICDAIDLPSVATGMRLLAHALAASHEVVSDMTLDDNAINDLCRTLHLEESAAAAVQLLVGERIDAHLPWIRAAFHYAGGTKTTEACHATELAYGDDVPALIAALASLAAKAGFDPDRLFEACRRAFTTEQFRELLELEFGRFNDSLAATGSNPITYPTLHASQLLNYIVEHEIAILEALRNAAAASLDELELATDYKTKRDQVRLLAPDPNWLTRYHMVPDELLAAHLAHWLSDIGSPPLGANPQRLPALMEVRAANVALIAKVASVAAPLVRAWWRMPADSLPDFWRDGRAAEQRLRTALDAAGVIDYRPLDGPALLAWCVKLGLWPEGMPPSLDRAKLELAEGQVDAAEEAARREAAERAAKARAVRFNGRDVDPEQADWTAISAEISTSLSRQVKNVRLNALTDLATVKPRNQSDRDQRKPNRSAEAPDRTPQTKKDMIGRLGELVVYHWLKDRYRTQDIDKAWVSKNAALQNGTSSSDELGYDFELEHDRRTWLIEVKARQGDSCRFELGESEVRKAREAARPRSGMRYIIIYVADPGNSNATRIDVLPNPMSEEADGVLELLGGGVRYAFHRKAAV